MRGKGVGRLAAAGVGVVLLSGFGGAALADDGEVESQEAEIWFEVLSPPEPGALSMSVEVVGSADGPEAELAEGTSDDPAVRVFTGSLPLVTVKYTRQADQIPDGAGWYVLGQATDFAGDAGQAPIPRENLGWVPFLGPGVDQGSVSAGLEALTALDPGEPEDPDSPDSPIVPNEGLADKVLLAGTDDSAAILSQGSWSAGADLVLKTGPVIEAGVYTSVLTLTLFE